MAVKSNIEDQKLLVSLFKSNLENIKNLNVHVLSKTDHLRVKISPMQLDKIFSSIAKYSILEQMDDYVSHSGEYVTKILQLNEDIEFYKTKTAKNTTKIKKGTQCYFINTGEISKKNKSLTAKDLTPERLGLQISDYRGFSAINKFDKDVYEGINKQNVSNEIKYFLRQVYFITANTRKRPTIRTKFSATQGGYKECELLINYPTNNKNFTDVVKLIAPDINIIGKNFGEILALRWCLSRDKYYNFMKFGYPTASNEALIDCYVYTKVDNKIFNTISGKKNAISVKYDKGAAPSITSMLPLIDNIKPILKTQELKEKAETLKYFDSDKKTAIYQGTNSDKFLKVAELLSSKNYKAYTALEKIFKKYKISTSSTIKIGDLNNLIDTILKSGNDVISEFDEYFKITNSVPKQETIDKVLKSDKSNYYNIICFSLATYLKNALNADEDFVTILNAITNKNKIDQVYVTFTPSGIKFKSKEFSDNKFKFDYNGKGDEANNSNIKFKMI